MTVDMFEALYDNEHQQNKHKLRLWSFWRKETFVKVDYEVLTQHKLLEKEENEWNLLCVFFF